MHERIVSVPSSQSDAYASASATDLYHHDPSISFEVNLMDGTQMKNRVLVLTERSVGLSKGANVISNPNPNVWKYPADDVIGMVASKTDKKKFTISVVQRYEFVAEDADQVLRIQDVFKGLNLGRSPVLSNGGYSQPDQQESLGNSFGGVGGRSTATETIILRPNNGLNSGVSTNGPPSPIHANGVSSARPVVDRPNSASAQQDSADEHKAVSASSVAIRDPNRHNGRYGLQDFEIIKVVGEGSFGKVMKVKRRDDNKIFAMKMLALKDYPGDPFAEQKILEGLDCPFIVKLHCWFEENQRLYLVMDYAEYGDLFYHLRKAGKFSEELAVFYLAEIILALDYLHRRHIVYRDLKPENILVDADGHVKIGDLGLAKQGITSTGGIVAEGSKAQTFCGTPQYLAPEILKGVDHGLAVDWWSTGIVLYEMLTGGVPFYSENRNEMYSKAIRGEIFFPSHVSRDAQSFIRAVLVRRPEDRLGSGIAGISEIKSHFLFRNVRWRELEQGQIMPPSKPMVSDVPAFGYGLSSIGNKSTNYSSSGSGLDSLARRERDILMGRQPQSQSQSIELNNSTDITASQQPIPTSNPFSQLSHSDSFVGIDGHSSENLTFGGTSTLRTATFEHKSSAFASNSSVPNELSTIDSLLSTLDRNQKTNSEKQDNVIDSVLRSFVTNYDQ